MSVRSEISKLRGEVTRLSSYTAASTSDFSGNPAGLQAAGFQDPYAWQRSVLENEEDDQMLVVSRQGGKSTTVATKALHRALYRSHSLVLIIAPSLRQSQELFFKCVYLHRITGSIVPADNLSKSQMELTNGSRIVALPGSESTVRGYSSPQLVICDEAAKISDDTFYALTPMLAASDGQLIALSTPAGKRGWFYHEWTEGRDDWKRVEVTATEVDHISEAFLKRERRRMPVPVFNSEYMCVFGDTVDSVFRSVDIEAMFTDDVEPLFPEAA